MEQDRKTEKPGEARHDQARRIAERAREHYEAGDARTGDDLAGQATALDREAVAELIAETDEDHAVKKR